MSELTKPRQVVTAGRIMWTLWAAGGVLILVGLIGAIARSQPGILILACQFLIAMSLLALLIRAVLRGKNWARIVYTVIACIAMGVLGMYLVSTQVGATNFALSAVVVIAYSSILILLFHRECGPWFRQGKFSS